MAALASFQSRVLAGPINLACHARDISLGYTVDMVDITTLADPATGLPMTAKAFIPGQLTGDFSAGGPLDVVGTAGSNYATLVGALGAATNLPITYAARGLSALNEAILLAGVETSFGSSNTPTGSADWTMSAQATGVPDIGFMLEDLTAVTIDGNGSSRDLTAGSTNGGVAHLHVSAFSGLTNNIVTIEHSTTGSGSWSTLVTFATVTGLTSERVEIAAGTTVNRYLRVVDNVTGTGSCTRSVAFARR